MGTRLVNAIIGICAFSPTLARPPLNISLIRLFVHRRMESWMLGIQTNSIKWDTNCWYSTWLTWEDGKQWSRIRLPTDDNASMYDETDVGEVPSDSDYHALPLRIAMGGGSQRTRNLVPQDDGDESPRVHICGNVDYLIVCIGLDWIGFQSILDCV